MDNTIQHLAENILLITSSSTWIEENAIQQLKTTARLPYMHSVAGMPDLHPGRGYPIGAAFFTVNHLYPALVGNDIGCGMGLWKTNLSRRKINIHKMIKKIGDIDGPLEDEHSYTVTQQFSELHAFHASLGTLGGGNHFAELQSVDVVYDSSVSVEAEQVFLLVHSGSRGLGQSILQQHLTDHGHGGISANSEAADAYLRQHQQALDFARANRALIATRILNRLHCSGERILDCFHNLVTPCEIKGESGWLHRKGATPADQGMVIIPGSRGDHSYLVQPIPNANSLLSLAHGAGRKWMRSDCKARLSGYQTAEQLIRTRLGSHVICKDKALLYEEAPEAYKSIDSIIRVLQQAGLVKVIARLRPLLTYKTQGGSAQ